MQDRDVQNAKSNCRQYHYCDKPNIEDSHSMINIHNKLNKDTDLTDRQTDRQSVQQQYM